VPRCFVAQPFDGGEYDERYKEVYEPAIRAAGLKPYRVDQDPAASIPVETIFAETKACSAVFVDISVDNPNVWFELGLAVANGKPLCIVCKEERSRFPFDIQHRLVIRYKTQTPGDFQLLSSKITLRLKAIVEMDETITATVNEVMHSNKDTAKGSRDTRNSALQLEASRLRRLVADLMLEIVQLEEFLVTKRPRH